MRWWQYLLGDAGQRLLLLFSSHLQLTLSWVMWAVKVQKTIWRSLRFFRYENVL